MSHSQLGSPEPGRLFTQFTFYSILIPGLFCTMMVVPILPWEFFSDTGTLLPILLWLSFAFLSGITFYIFSDVVEKAFPYLPFTTTPTDRLYEKLRVDSEQTTVELTEETRQEFIGHWETEIGVELAADDGVEEKAECIEDEEAEGVDAEEGGREDDGGGLEESEVDAMYRLTVNEIWERRDELPSTLINMYFLCRNCLVQTFVFACLYGAIISFNVTNVSPVDRGTITDMLVDYAPVFSQLNLPFPLFSATISAMLLFSAITFLVGYNIFGEYYVKYLILSGAERYRESR